MALKVLTHAGDGAAGADTCHKDIYLPVGILPDFGAGGDPVDGGIGGVHKLAGNEAVRNFLCQLLSLGDGTLHTLGTFRQYQLRAVGLHELAALHAHGFGHDDDDAIAPGGGDGSQTDAGVAGGGFNDDAAGLQQTLLLRVVDHSLGDAVFHGACGVEVFQLGKDLRFQTQFLLNVYQLQQGSLSDQLIGGCINLTHNQFLLIMVVWCCLKKRCADSIGRIRCCSSIKTLLSY